MFCSKTANNRIDKLHERALRLVYDDYETATLLKVILLHGHFSRFLNCAKGTKSRKASQVLYMANIIFVLDLILEFLV